MEFADLQTQYTAFDGNLNNPDQPNAQEFEYAGGLLSRIVGTKESRKATVSRVSNAVVAPLEKVPVLTKIVGTQQSRAIVASKVKSAAKTIGLAPARGAMLGLIRINAFNIAFALKKNKDAKSSNWNTIRNSKWAKWGGNRTEFDEVVDKGSKVKAPLGLKFKKTKGADGIDYLEAAGETAALIAAAAPLIIGIIDALGKNSGIEIDAQSAAGIAAQAAAESATTAENQRIQDEINAQTTEEERSTSDNTIIKYVLIVGGVLAVAGITYLLFFRKKK